MFVHRYDGDSKERLLVNMYERYGLEMAICDAQLRIEVKCPF